MPHCKLKLSRPWVVDAGGFPKSVCTSVNEVMCHGIPDARQLCKGDILNIDVTVYLNVRALAFLRAPTCILCADVAATGFSVACSACSDHPPCPACSNDDPQSFMMHVDALTPDRLGFGRAS